MKFGASDEKEKAHQHPVDLVKWGRSVRVFDWELISVPYIVNLRPIGREGNLCMLTFKTAYHLRSGSFFDFYSSHCFKTGINFTGFRGIKIFNCEETKIGVVYLFRRIWQICDSWISEWGNQLIHYFITLEINNQALWHQFQGHARYMTFIPDVIMNLSLIQKSASTFGAGVS